MKSQQRDNLIMGFLANACDLHKAAWRIEFDMETGVLSTSDKALAPYLIKMLKDRRDMILASSLDMLQRTPLGTDDGANYVAP